MECCKIELALLFVTIRIQDEVSHRCCMNEALIITTEYISVLIN